GMLRRLPLTLGRLGLDLIPVIGFLLVTHLMLGTAVGGQLGTRLVLIALAGAYALCAAVLAVVRTLFAPSARGLRLFSVSDEFAEYVVRWTRRIAIVTVFGYALGEAGLLLGLSPVAHEGLMKGVGLIDHVLVAIIIVQSRRVVRDWIMPAPGRTGVLVQMRQRLALYWHWIALFYVAALWLVWAIEIPDGFTAILRIFALSMTVLMVARIVVIVLHGSLDRLVTPREETLAKYPDLEGRLRLWRPILHAMVDVVIYALVLIELLEVWGFGAVRWLFGTDLGWHLVSAFSTLLLTIAIAMLVWEAANHAIERHLARLTRSQQLARSARLRTLLPMLRTVLLVSILVVVALLVLSEIGLNVAPLIAGASVLGIAIGFGSQKLVQDVITGLFLLLENTVQVGDVVSLGGLSGVVEDLSVRTIRLRSEDGSVHVIPFSAVTTVTNMTRDFGHAVIEVGVAYKENYDRVVQVMRDIVAQMRNEPRWEDEIRDDLEVLGLNAFADSSVMIKARIKCGPFGRWSLLREFNRRLKERFDAEGIEIPFPHQQLVLTDPITLASRPATRGGDAPDRPIAAQ
ncbi:MAG: mechanosensitive ion channel, partial [Proteobacteria bacterium]|nr:mechanosensitive ion channel [Pseudomonadota bacterium]